MFFRNGFNVIKDVADPVAQALAVIPNPYQPYAQAYTGIRSTGIGGDYKGLQVGGYTPGAYGGQYGLNPFSSGNIFQTQGIIPTFDATNPNTGESVLDAFGSCRTGSNMAATKFSQIFSVDFDRSGAIVSASIQVRYLLLVGDGFESLPKTASRLKTLNQWRAQCLLGGGKP